MSPGRDGGATPPERETGRIESFSDGVFSVAITLLVLNLTVPELTGTPTAAGLALALGEHWPAYLAFVTSFGTILIMWVNHHAVVKLARRADTLFMFANGFLLLQVTAVPFATALVARYLGTPAAATASAVYAGLFAIGNVAYNLLWWSVVHKGRLLQAHVSLARVNQLTRSFLLGFPIYLAATGLAFVNAYASMAICSSLWILWAITGYERLPAREPHSP